MLPILALLKFEFDMFVWLNLWNTRILSYHFIKIWYLYFEQMEVQ